MPTVLDLTDALVGRDGRDTPCPTASPSSCAPHVDPEADIHASADYRRMLAGELTRRALVAAAAEHHVEGAA